MSTPRLEKNEKPFPSGVYRITIERDGNWADTEYTWAVHAWDMPDSTDPLWKGRTETGWGARRQAHRAVKKLRKGKKPPQPRVYPEVIYVYP